MISQLSRTAGSLTAPRALLGVQAATLALLGVPTLVLGFSAVKGSAPEFAALVKLSLEVGVILTLTALTGAALAVALPRARRLPHFAIAYELALALVAVLLTLAGFVIAVLSFLLPVLALAAIITVQLFRHLRAARPPLPQP
ncbi:hypothetical protein AB0L06_28320 [Spirillospora sp. NPDC052269]